MLRVRGAAAVAEENDLLSGLKPRDDAAREFLDESGLRAELFRRGKMGVEMAVDDLCWQFMVR